MEEAIQELLQGHANTSIDDAEKREAGRRYQRLKLKSDVLESLLKVLKDAKKAADQACDPEALGRGQNTNYLMIIGPASQRNVAAQAHTSILQRTQKPIESVIQTLTQEQIKETSEGADRGFIPPWSSPIVMSPVFLSGQLQERISLLGEQLAEVRWRQNDLLPIARLPPEILIKVFAFALDLGGYRFRDDTSFLGAVLTHICRDWTRLIDNTPSLWTRISPYRSTIEHVAMALEKSKPLPINLYFDEYAMKHMRLDVFSGVIRRHADRWKVLDVDMCSSRAPDILNSRLSKLSTPRLETLRVSVVLPGYEHVYDTTPFEINFIKGGWPDTLKNLLLNRVGVPYGSFSELRGLKSLEIYRLPPGREVNVAETLRALSNCPELEKLLLGMEITLGRRFFGATLGYPSTPVRLNRLREISLWLRAAPLHAFLRSIQTINCTKFHIETSMPENGRRAWTKVLLTAEIRPFVRVMESVLHSASAISIEGRDGTLKLNTEPQDNQCGVCLKLYGDHCSEVGRWIAKSLALGPAGVTLTIGAFDTTWLKTVPFIFSTFHNIVKLTVYGADKIDEQAIDFLGNPLSTDSAGYKQFPVPRLVSLAVSVDLFPGVISMVKRRYGRHGSNELTGTRRPVELSKLRLLTSMGRGERANKLVEQLVLCLPGCEVEWS